VGDVELRQVRVGHVRGDAIRRGAGAVRESAGLERDVAQAIELDLPADHLAIEWDRLERHDATAVASAQAAEEGEVAGVCADVEEGRPGLNRLGEPLRRLPLVLPQRHPERVLAMVVPALASQRTARDAVHPAVSEVQVEQRLHGSAQRAEPAQTAE
jgi:hypothetical protein